jgi:hypothetical protein
MASPKTTSKPPKAAGTRGAKRYRINPLELLIFTLVTAGFGFSVYHLFLENEGLQFATLQPMQTSPNRMVPGKDVARSIAAIAADGAAPVANPIQFEVNCADNPGYHFGGQVCPTEPTHARTFPDSPRNNPTKIRSF